MWTLISTVKPHLSSKWDGEHSAPLCDGEPGWSFDRVPHWQRRYRHLSARPLSKKVIGTSRDKRDSANYPSVEVSDKRKRKKLHWRLLSRWRQVSYSITAPPQSIVWTRPLLTITQSNQCSDPTSSRKASGQKKLAKVPKDGSTNDASPSFVKNSSALGTSVEILWNF